MFRNYLFVWLTITFGGSLINTFYWWLDEMIFSIPDPGFNHGFDHFAFIYIFGFILSSVCSFPYILMIYLIEVWKKIPFTIWLHIVIFAVNLVGISLFPGFDEDALFGFMGYEFAGILGYYVFVYRKQVRSRDYDLLDS